MANLSNYELWNLILQAIVIISMVVTAVIYFKNLKKLEEQVSIQVKEIKLDFEYKKTEKALEMCKFYECILTDIFKISDTYKKHWKLNNVKYEHLKFRDFNISEFYNNYGGIELSELNNISDKILIEDFLNSEFLENKDSDYVKLISIFKSRDYKNFTKEEINDENEKHNFEFLVLKTRLMKDFLIKKDSVMNKLEYFAMNFSSGLADEEVVYQSLHQSYLSVVAFLYPAICKANVDSGQEKFYTSIIKLYNIWIERQEEKNNIERTINNQMKKDLLHVKGKL